MITSTACAHFIFYALIATTFLYCTCEGSANCYECNSESDSSCIPQSVSGAREGRCSRGNNYCAAYKREPLGNSSTHQYSRYCASKCSNITYTLGTYEKTKHCILCCDEDFCNSFTIDPCNPPSKAGRLGKEILTIAVLGSVLAVVFNNHE